MPDESDGLRSALSARRRTRLVVSLVMRLVIQLTAAGMALGLFAYLIAGRSLGRGAFLLCWAVGLLGSVVFWFTSHEQRQAFGAWGPLSWRGAAWEADRLGWSRLVVNSSRLTMTVYQLLVVTLLAMTSLLAVVILRNSPQQP